MTLSELLIATILVGIVMVGVLAVDYAMHNLQKSSTTDSLLALQTSAAFIAISRDAMTSTGDSTGDPTCAGNNLGILCDDDGSERSICFRHDVPDISGNYTPFNYDDDQWQCYYNDSTALYRCTPGTIGMPCSGQKLFNTNNQADFFEMNWDPPASPYRLLNISFTLRAIANPSEPEHPINNPVYVQSFQINPLSASR